MSVRLFVRSFVCLLFAVNEALQMKRRLPIVTITVGVPLTVASVAVAVAIVVVAIVSVVLLLLMLLFYQQTVLAPFAVCNSNLDIVNNQQKSDALIENDSTIYVIVSIINGTPIFFATVASLLAFWC